eukprot:2779683-Rhodomonas_salina.5
MHVPSQNTCALPPPRDKGGRAQLFAPARVPRVCACAGWHVTQHVMRHVTPLAKAHSTALLYPISMCHVA